MFIMIYSVNFYENKFPFRFHCYHREFLNVSQRFAIMILYVLHTRHILVEIIAWPS